MLVDEVLAVGDIQFQRKCLDRMRGLAGGQTTIIFVSHNMAAIHALCNRCLLLDAGRSVKIGPTTDVATQYLQHHAPTQHFVRKHPLPKKACVTEADVRIGAISPELPGTLLQAKLKLWSPEKMKIAVQFRIKDPLGSNIAFASLGQFNPEDLLQLQAGEATLNVAIPIDQIAQGEYSLDIVLVIPMVALVDSVDDCIRFSVDRAPRPGHLRALQQSWGYGCVELPIHFAEAAIQVSSQHSFIEHSVTY
jgi:lipopolysaccharide transport system ATP-binding protein